MKKETELKLINRIQLISMRLFAKVIRFFGFKPTYMMANIFAFFVWNFSKERRNLATRNIEKHLDVSADKAREIARASFSENFCSFAEILHTQNFSCDELGKRLFIPTQKNWEDFQKCDRPIVATTGHFGSWELLASMLGDIISTDRPRTSVVRKYPNPAVQQFITEQREARGATMIGHRLAAVTVLRALRKKGLVAFLVDHRPRKSESIMLPFLGQETAVNIGPALLAVRAKAVIWPIFLNREKNGTYTYYIHDSLDTAILEGTLEEKIAAAALFYTQAVETHVRQYPSQWFWMHDRWRKPH